MAIYHLCIKIISRGKGKSAVAASAYRSGEKIKNEYDGIVHDFTRKGGIAHTEILLPQNAPQEFSDRGTLWNSVEKIEKSKTKKWKFQNKKNRYSRLEQARQGRALAKSMGRHYK